MGLKRFERFARYAERRLVESVRDCGDDSPRSKAETTRAAVDGYSRLAGIGKTVYEAELVAERLRELFSGETKAPPPKIEIVLEDQAEQAGDEGPPEHSDE
jgi:hypothetical protein